MWTGAASKDGIARKFVAELKKKPFQRHTHSEKEDLAQYTYEHAVSPIEIFVLSKSFWYTHL